MKYFYILDENSNDVCCLVYAKSEKSALNKYKNGLLTSGFYYIVTEDKHNYLLSSYGSKFSANICHYPEVMQRSRFLTVIR